MKNVYQTRSWYVMILVVFIGHLYTVLSIPARTAMAQSPPRVTHRNAVQKQWSGATPLQGLLSEAAAHGTVRVIVKLAMEQQTGSASLSVQDFRGHRANMARAQGTLLASLSAQRVSHVKSFQFLPYMAMQVDSEALTALMGEQAVADIVPDRLIAPTLAESVPLIHATQADTTGMAGAGWSVAILDTGVDKTHLLLHGGKVVSEACYSTTVTSEAIFSLCPNGQDVQVEAGAGVNCAAQIDGCYHGTHVAGIAASDAAGTSRPDLNGVAPGADIIAIQVFSGINSSSQCAEAGQTAPCVLAFMSDILQGLEQVYALRDTFNIAAVNLSLGGSTKFTSPCDAQSPLTEVIGLLRSANVPTVIASGNGAFTDGLSEPACISSAISVGNTGKNDAVYYSSNSSSLLSLFAPGTFIVSASPGNQLRTLTGTSMAAPHVAGAFAILKQARPSASVSELLAALQNTGVPIFDSRNGLTKPRLDVKAALDSFGVPAVGLPEITNPAPGMTLPGATVTFTWRSNGAAVIAWWLQLGSHPGGTGLYDSGWLGTQLSTTVAGLPTNGQPVYARLWYFIAGAWQAQEFFYIAASSSGGTPEMTAPTPGMTLPGARVTFAWRSNGAAVNAWWLYLGVSPGGAELYNSGWLGTQLSTTVAGLPTNGRPVYARLWYFIAGAWQAQDFLYIAARNSRGTAEITAPALGTALPGRYGERYVAQ